MVAKGLSRLSRLIDDQLRHMGADNSAEARWREARLHLKAREWDRAEARLAELSNVPEPAPIAHRAADALSEIARYIAATTRPVGPDRTAVMMEPLGASPDAIFTFAIDGSRYVGRKLLSSLWLDDRIDELFCS